MSIGEDRVRVFFVPGGNSLVEELKAKTAELIDLCESIKPIGDRELDLAQTAYEEACMWAVKAATTKVKGSRG